MLAERKQAALEQAETVTTSSPKTARGKKPAKKKRKHAALKQAEVVTTSTPKTARGKKPEKPVAAVKKPAAQDHSERKNGKEAVHAPAKKHNKQNKLSKLERNRRI